MADEGYLADRNEIADSPCTISSNVSWVPTSPLSSMRTTPLIDAAECSVLGTAESPVVIEVVWDYPIDITYGGLFDTNLRQEAYWLFEAFADAAATDLLYSTISADGRAKRVVPALYDPATLRPGSSNWLRGGLDQRDFRLYPTNIHTRVPLNRVRAVRWKLWGSAYNPNDSDAPGYRIGLVWAGDGISFMRHVGASGESIRSNDERIEMPGGAVWVERGTPKRVAIVDRTVTDKTLRDALFDMAFRAGQHKPMVWLPNDKLQDCFRYGGLFRRQGDHGHKYMAPMYTSGTIELEEWKE